MRGGKKTKQVKTHGKPKSRLIFEKESLEIIQHKDLSPI